MVEPDAGKPLLQRNQKLEADQNGAVAGSASCRDADHIKCGGVAFCVVFEVDPFQVNVLKVANQFLCLERDFDDLETPGRNGQKCECLHV